ncbi:hypothetical protein [Streptomyces sp. NBC_01435]|uniref:hypothetical protein n=1 Tax=Streptomyces sp. NBC_01435 TaxID=2903865 RepID=UPI002E326243|nr:hypothetical protein [Streptomyces sp. NBC_01435]
MEELPYRRGLFARPLLPVAPVERAADLLRAEEGFDAARDEGPGELREDPAQHRRVVAPVGSPPGALQEIVVQLDVRDLEQGEVLGAAPVALAVVLVAACGHAAEGDREVVQRGVEAAAGGVRGGGARGGHGRDRLQGSGG